MKTMSKWISVTDRLPKDSSPVLTVYSNVYGEMVLALNDYDSECDNPWHDSGRDSLLDAYTANPKDAGGRYE